MAWKLQLNNEIKAYFLEGRDHVRRMSLQHEVITKNMLSPNAKGLQVGVPSNTDKKISDKWIAIDLYDKRPCIDYNMDLCDLSFKDNMFDFILCNAVLEHVKDPFKCASEMYRVTKPGGEIWVEVPFVQAYHPTKDYDENIHGIIDNREKDFNGDINHGGDYWRFTPQGIVELMKPFIMKDVLIAVCGGIAYYGVKNNG